MNVPIPNNTTSSPKYHHPGAHNPLKINANGPVHSITHSGPPAYHEKKLNHGIIPNIMITNSDINSVIAIFCLPLIVSISSRPLKFFATHSLSSAIFSAELNDLFSFLSTIPA